MKRFINKQLVLKSLNLYYIYIYRYFYFFIIFTAGRDINSVSTVLLTHEFTVVYIPYYIIYKKNVCIF